jgi:hypothetical protein
MLAGEQSGLLTHIAVMESVALSTQKKKLAAFLKLEPSIRAATRRLVNH